MPTKKKRCAVGESVDYKQAITQFCYQQESGVVGGYAVNDIMHVFFFSILLMEPGSNTGLIPQGQCCRAQTNFYLYRYLFKEKQTTMRGKFILSFS